MKTIRCAVLPMLLAVVSAPAASCSSGYDGRDLFGAGTAGTSNGRNQDGGTVSTGGAAGATGFGGRPGVGGGPGIGGRPVVGGAAGNVGMGGGPGLDAGDGGKDVGVGPGDAQSDSSTPSFDAGTDAPTVVDAGCGTPARCRLGATMLHRYSFQGIGTKITDSVGTAHATAVNVNLVGNGNLQLVAGANQYVRLPSGIIHPLTNATFEVWLTWDGIAGWERIFDFGDNDQGVGFQGQALSTFYLTPRAAAGDTFAGPDVLLAGFKRRDEVPSNEMHLPAMAPLTTSRLIQLAVVIDETNVEMRLYQNGILERAVPFFDSLSTLNDVNNWLGRSQYADDPTLGGTLHEFRIYGAALTQTELQESFIAGPRATF